MCNYYDGRGGECRVDACVGSREQTFKLAQVSFENSDKADQELREFNDNASLGDDASEVCKAFIAENYVQTEEEVAQTAFESWIQFKEKSKLIIGVRLPPLTLLNSLLLPCNPSSFRLTMHSKSTIQRARLRLATRPPSLPYSIKRRNFSVSQVM